MRFLGLARSFVGLALLFSYVPAGWAAEIVSPINKGTIGLVCIDSEGRMIPWYDNQPPSLLSLQGGPFEECVSGALRYRQLQADRLRQQQRNGRPGPEIPAGTGASDGQSATPETIPPETVHGMSLYLQILEVFSRGL